MRSQKHITLIVLFLLCSSTFAEENNDDIFISSLSFNLSYPLIASYSVGAILPAGEQDMNEAFPSAFSLRVDGEAGIGGGSASIGVYIPANGSLAFNIKASKMRTWLVGSSEIRNKTYNGAILELVTLGHVPGKVGIGYFKEANASGNQEEHFTYFSIGVGW